MNDLERADRLADAEARITARLAGEGVDDLNVTLLDDGDRYKLSIGIYWLSPEWEVTPEEAAHTLGVLLKCAGERLMGVRVVWPED